MSNEITFDEIKVGDRIKTREVFREGSIVEQEFTVEDKRPNYAGTDYLGVFLRSTHRAELTITRIAVQEPQGVGAVVEMKRRDGVTVIFTRLFPECSLGIHWKAENGNLWNWNGITAEDPNPIIHSEGYIIPTGKEN